MTSTVTTTDTFDGDVLPKKKRSNSFVKGLRKLASKSRLISSSSSSSSSDVVEHGTLTHPKKTRFSIMKKSNNQFNNEFQQTLAALAEHDFESASGQFNATDGSNSTTTAAAAAAVIDSSIPKVPPPGILKTSRNYRKRKIKEKEEQQQQHEQEQAILNSPLVPTIPIPQQKTVKFTQYNPEAYRYRRVKEQEKAEYWYSIDEHEEIRLNIDETLITLSNMDWDFRLMDKNKYCLRGLEEFFYNEVPGYTIQEIRVASVASVLKLQDQMNAKHGITKNYRRRKSKKKKRSGRIKKGWGGLEKIRARIQNRGNKNKQSSQSLSQEGEGDMNNDLSQRSNHDAAENDENKSGNEANEYLIKKEKEAYESLSDELHNMLRKRNQRFYKRAAKFGQDDASETIRIYKETLHSIDRRKKKGQGNDKNDFFGDEICRALVKDFKRTSVTEPLEPLPDNLLDKSNNNKNSNKSNDDGKNEGTIQTEKSNIQDQVNGQDSNIMTDTDNESNSDSKNVINQAIDKINLVDNSNNNCIYAIDQSNNDKEDESKHSEKAIGEDETLPSNVADENIDDKRAMNGSSDEYVENDRRAMLSGALYERDSIEDYTEIKQELVKGKIEEIDVADGIFLDDIY